MVKKQDPERERAREILSYFVRNPRAADSIEGVARWRLLDQTIHRTVDETRQALQWLVAQGFLRESKTMGSGTIFDLNPERQAEALRFLGPERDAEGEREDPGGGDR